MPSGKPSAADSGARMKELEGLQQQADSLHVNDHQKTRFFDFRRENCMTGIIILAEGEA